MKYKPLNEYSNEELIEILSINNEIELNRLGALCSEILRRMNLQKPLFDKEDEKNN